VTSSSFKLVLFSVSFSRLTLVSLLEIQQWLEVATQVPGNLIWSDLYMILIFALLLSSVLTEPDLLIYLINLIFTFTGIF
jgi:hypothetical protein